jgi:dUTP pyrophosphatase
MDQPVVRCTGPQAALPAYQSEGASGADLCACIDAEVVIAPGDRALIPTGLVMDIPKGLEGQVRPRSGLAARNGVTVLNTPGTIDSDYRGEIKVILANLGREEFRVRPGDRIAQIVFVPVVRVSFSRGERLSETARGSGGFGSTGV